MKPQRRPTKRPLLRSEARVAAYDHWVDRQARADELAELVSEMAAHAYQESGSQIQGVTDRFEDLFRLYPGLLTDDLTAMQQNARSAASDADVAMAGSMRRRRPRRSQPRSETTWPTSSRAVTKNLRIWSRRTPKPSRSRRSRPAATTTSTATTSAPSSTAGRTAPSAQDAVRYALDQVGKPYEWGAEGPHTFDCSGLVADRLRQAGRAIAGAWPTTSSERRGRWRSTCRRCCPVI